MTDTIGLKTGVTLTDLDWHILIAIGVIWGIFHSHNTPLTITSGTDSIHGAHSLHYSAKAIDIRTRTMPNGTAWSITSDIKSALDLMGFDVVLEKDHIHLEYDPKPTDSPLTESTT